MTLQSSGAITMSQINSEFGLGYSLGPYRGNRWFTASGTTGTFPSSPSAINMSGFYSKRSSSPVYVTYPSSSTNGTPFSWSISYGVPGEGWWATSNAPNHTTFGSSSSPFAYLDGSGSASFANGDWSPDTGTITVTFYFQYGGTQSRTITVSPPPTFYVNVSGPDVNLYWYCTARGWNGSSAVVATTVGNVYGSSTGSWAMIIDAMPSSVTLINNNYIVGHGGRGGHGGDYTGYSGGENGEGGGPGLYVSASNHGVTIYNYGVIGGGGGGGGGAALYEHGYSCCGQDTTDYYGGDGGGGGAAYGAGGRGGSVAGSYTGYIGELSSGDPGTDAGFTNHGNGGSYRTYGGNGGGIGQGGTNGGAGGGYGIGYGAGSGWAVYGTNRVTWASYGTVSGPTGNT